MSNERISEKEKITDIYGANGFVKIKQAWDINKVLFSFVDIKSKKYINCYMKPARVQALVEDFQRNIIDQLRKDKVDNAIQKNNDYPENIWMSTYGGGESNGNCFSRYFTIAPGMKNKTGNYGYAVLTAYEIPAKKTDIGGYEPIKGSKPSLLIRVPVASRDDFRDIIIEVREALKCYYSWRYAYENVCSVYQKDVKENQKSPEAEKKAEISNASIASSARSTISQQKCENFNIMSAINKTAIAHRKKSPVDYSIQVFDDKQKLHNIVFLAQEISKVDKSVWGKFVIACAKTGDQAHSFKFKYEEGMEDNITILYFKGFC